MEQETNSDGSYEYSNHIEDHQDFRRRISKTTKE